MYHCTLWWGRPVVLGLGGCCSNPVQDMFRKVKLFSHCNICEGVLDWGSWGGEAYPKCWWPHLTGEFFDSLRRRKWTRYGCVPCVCLLTLNTVWPAASGLIAVTSSPWWTVSFHCGPEQALPSLSCFCRICCHSPGKRTNRWVHTWYRKGGTSK